MAYQRFRAREIEWTPATLATPATVEGPSGAKPPATLATVATTATVQDGAAPTVATVAGVAEGVSNACAEAAAVERETGMSASAGAAGTEDFQESAGAETPKTRETTLPASTPGVTIRRPAIEVSAAEYDAHLDRMIAEAEANAAEASFLSYVKTRGWVVPRGAETIFTRGR